MRLPDDGLIGPGPGCTYCGEVYGLHKEDCLYKKKSKSQPRPSISVKRMWEIARVYAGDDDIATMDDVFDALSAAMAEAGVIVEEKS